MNRENGWELCRRVGIAHADVQVHPDGRSVYVGWHEADTAARRRRLDRIRGHVGELPEPMTSTGPGELYRVTCPSGTFWLDARIQGDDADRGKR